MKVSKQILLLVLGCGHALNDFIAGYFLGNLSRSHAGLAEISLGLFLYNLLAFGGQYPVALLLERFNHPKKALLFAYSLNLMAVCLFPLAILPAIILAGIASAFYHVTGGTVCAADNKAVNIGFFAAPGVAGLILGGWIAYRGINLATWLQIMTLVFIVILFFLRITKKPEQVLADEKPGKPIDNHDLVMILLLTFICLRSAIWNIFQLIHENEYDWLLVIAGAAFLGKILGGWLADKIGWRLYSFIALLLATPLITFFKKEISLFAIGIGLLQSTIPATTSLLINALGKKTGRAISLSFGTAILAGVLIFYTPLRDIFLSNAVLFISALVMLLCIALRGKKYLIAK
jgi:MFS transporter, FSR family, fosmidomycin resistance protein